MLSSSSKLMRAMKARRAMTVMRAMKAIEAIKDMRAMRTDGEITMDADGPLLFHRAARGTWLVVTTASPPG